MVLRVLLVEDSEDDAALLGRALEHGGFSPLEMLRVQTSHEVEAALGASSWDVMITDYSLPNFSGPAALALVASAGRDIPVIIVSGTVSEEAAVIALRAGARDFMTKDQLTRLVPAIQREVREAAQRRERARALEALRISEDRHRMLFESSPLPTLVFDAETRAILDANDVALRCYGYVRDAFLGMSLDATIDPPDIARWNEALRKAGIGVARFSGRQRTREGVVIDVEVATHELSWGTRRARLAVVNDVTERKRLEERLRQSQKMQAVGQLAGGVAHDFNNMLAIILSYSDLVSDALEEKSPLREDLTEIRCAAERASSLTRQLLAFSRQQVLQPVELRMNRVVGELERMLKRTIGEHVTLTTELDDDVGYVRVDPGQLEQIVLNLVVNARDAMPRGGWIEIRTRNHFVPAAGANDDVPTGDYVALEVKDSGIGMDARTKARIFEPFFTTKPVGHGTGLGLSTVYGIVQQSEGHVTVASEPNKGTTFIVYLPRIEHAPSVRAYFLSLEAPRGKGRILVVEDDDQVRKLMTRILRSAGYEALEATDVEHARELATKNVGKLAALITDVVMPESSGPELAAEILRRCPGLPVLYVSGYAGDEMSSQGIPAGSSFLAKPFTPSLLRRKVVELLESKGPSSAASTT